MDVYKLINLNLFFINRVYFLDPTSLKKKELWGLEFLRFFLNNRSENILLRGQYSVVFSKN